METTAVPYTGTHPGPYMSAADRKESSGTTHTALTAAAAGEMQELDRDAAVLTPAEPAEVQCEAAQSADRAQTDLVAGTDNLEAVPGLVSRLNCIMARLPPGGVIVEEPPAYRIV